MKKSPHFIIFQNNNGTAGLQPDNGHGNQNCLGLWNLDQYYFDDKDCEAEYWPPLCEAAVSSSTSLELGAIALP